MTTETGDGDRAWHHHSFRVGYGETDQMGVVYYANYLDWFSRGRTEWLRATGLRYREDMEEQGILLPVLEARCRYHVSARYDDLIDLAAALDGLTPSRMRFIYRITRAEDGVLLAEGMTEHAFVDRDGKPFNLRKRAPGVWRVLAAAFDGSGRGSG